MNGTLALFYMYCIEVTDYVKWSQRDDIICVDFIIMLFKLSPERHGKSPIFNATLNLVSSFVILK